MAITSPIQSLASFGQMADNAAYQNGGRDSIRGGYCASLDFEGILSVEASVRNQAVNDEKEHISFFYCIVDLNGKRVLTLSHGRGTYFTGVGFIGWTKRFAYGYRTKVEEVESVHRGRNGTSVFHRLRLSSEGAADDVYICSGFSKDALAYTAAVLRRECRSA